jgi:hypothetical protein
MDGKFYVDCNGSLRTITWKDDDDEDKITQLSFSNYTLNFLILRKPYLCFILLRIKLFFFTFSTENKVIRWFETTFPLSSLWFFYDVQLSVGTVTISSFCNIEDLIQTFLFFNITLWDFFTKSYFSSVYF